MNKPIICEVIELDAPREQPPELPSEPQFARAPAGNGHEAALRQGSGQR